MKTRIYNLTTIFAAVFLFSLTGNHAKAVIPDGTYQQDFTGIVPVWDITGSYSGVVGDNISLDFSLSEDTSGKLTGTGTMHSDDGPGNVMDGAVTITGMVKNSSDPTRVMLTASLTSGSGTADVHGSIDPISFTGTIKLTCDIDGTNGKLVVTAGSASAKLTDLNTGEKHGMSTKFSGAELDLPVDVTGGWGVTLNLLRVSNKYTGTSTVQTAPGGTLDLTTIGSVSSVTNSSKLTLKGSGCSLSMAVTTSGTTLTVQSVKGKLYGQSLNIKAP